MEQKLEQRKIPELEGLNYVVRKQSGNYVISVLKGVDGKAISIEGHGITREEAVQAILEELRNQR